MKKLALAFMVVVSILFLMTEKANAEVKMTGYGIHIGSQHFPKQNFNNVNPGVFVRGSVTDVPLLPNGNYVLGTYFNSEKRQSLYAGYVYDVTDHIDVVIGAISGYRRAPVLPLVVPSIHFHVFGNWRARVSYLPKVEKSGSHVLHLSMEYRF